MTGSGDHAGLFAFLLGVIVVVFCGIGLSLVAEKKLSLGRSKVSIEDSIEKDRHELERLTDLKEAAKLSVEDRNPLARGQDELIRELEKQSEKNLGTLSMLRSDLSTLEFEIEEISGFRKRHDDQYRQQVRAAAVGEKLAELSLPGGKTYRSVIIRGCDSSGLKIQHRMGTARIAYRELPKIWRTRLHWHPEEERIKAPTHSAEKARLAEDTREHSEQQAVQDDRPQAPATKQEDETATDVDSLRLRVARAQEVYQEASSQAAEARRNATSGANRSVPGSLETWEERVERLDRWVRRIRKELYQAEDELRLVRPNDPLLRHSR